MKLRIHPALYAYLFCTLVLSSWQTCVGAMVSLLVHELGHCCVSYLFHEKIERLELTPFGGVIFYEEGKSPHKGIQGICIAAAGPMANYILLACIAVLDQWIDRELLYAIASSSMAMLLINLLPAFPLDGGRIIFCLGYYFFPLNALIRILCCMGIAVGIGFLCLSIYGLISQGILNCSVLIVGGYLIYCAQKSREQILLENFYTLIQETDDEEQQIKRVNAYRIPSNTPILHLIPFLGKNVACEFIVNLNGDEYRISEKHLCRMLLNHPSITIADAFFKKTEDDL